MKRKFQCETLLLYLTVLFISLNISCSKSVTEKNSNLVVARNENDANVVNKTDANSVEQVDTFVASPDWEIVSDKPNGRVVLVTINGKTPSGETQTILKLQCPAEQNPIVNLSYIVRHPELIKDFNFDNFEGPDAIAADEKLVEIEVVSPKQKLSSKISTAGWYGSPIDFEFGLHSDEQVARLIAEGSATTKITIYDYRDFKESIETTFPAIDSSGEVRKVLNGCRK